MFNIAKDFVTFLEANAVGVFNTDIFIGSVPLDAPSDAYWVVASGGSRLSARCAVVDEGRRPWSLARLRCSCSWRF